MALSHAQVLQILLALLTPAERDHAVAYLTERPVLAGTIEMGGQTLSVPWDAFAGFIDKEPRANWGHPSRYVLINAETGETRSIETRFPPLSKSNPGAWRLAYRAAGVHESFLYVTLPFEKER